MELLPTPESPCDIGETAEIAAPTHHKEELEEVVALDLGLLRHRR